MNIEWFDSMIGWFPILLVGVSAGAFGSIAGRVLPSEEGRKKWLPMLKGAFWTLLLVFSLLPLFGIAALMAHQSYSSSFLLAGVTGVGSLGSAYLILFRESHTKSENSPNKR